MDGKTDAAADAASVEERDVNEIETVKSKRSITLTHKALVAKVEKLQNVRKDKLSKIKNLRNVTQELMQSGNTNEIKHTLEKIGLLCGEAKDAHVALLPLMSIEERDKQDTWFAAKMIVESGFISEVEKWLVHDHGGEDDVNPDDSISNVASRHSHWKSIGSGKESNKSGKNSNKSGKSTASSRLKVEAERAALLARAAALKGKHALEAQEEQLRRQREQLEIDAEIAASTAKLAVFQAATECSSKSQAPSDGMNSYLQRNKEQNPNSKGFNPAANSFVPHTWNAMPMDSFTVAQKDSIGCNTHSAEGNPQQTLGSKDETKWKPETFGMKQYGNTEQSPSLPVHNIQPASVEQQHLYSVPVQGDLCTIMHRQNEITAALVQQQNLMSLPSRDIPAFDGDPLQYKTFIRAFEHTVESKASKADCLYFLEQFTRGQPRELVRSCQHMSPDRGYQQAKELLQEHFGNQYRIGAAYIEKALAWPAVKTEDVVALQAFSLFLRSCCNVMEELQYVKELDMPTNMRAIMTKLPYKYREKWRIWAHEILERSNRRACFKDMVSFIERQVKIISDPLFGNIQDMVCGGPAVKSVDKFKLHSKFSNIRGNSFATVTVSDAAQEYETSSSVTQKPDLKGSIQEPCVCCSQWHRLEECPKLKEKKHRDKIDFLMEKGMCFGCLCSGHRSKYCDRRLTCKDCGQSHPTVLHISGKTRASTGSEHTEGTAHVKQPSSETCGHTGAGKENSILSIVPVQVKTIMGSRIIQTYAFLDPGSTATFCSKQLMQRLNITGRRTSFLLRTMGQERVVSASTLNGLEVAGLGSNRFYSLPEVLTQNKMPVTTSNIITQGELQKWPYLSGVQIPCIDADVELLIGTNTPKVLEPWEVINSRDNGPYAIRTLLGWVVNGPLRKGESSEEARKEETEEKEVVEEEKKRKAEPLSSHPPTKNKTNESDSGGAPNEPIIADSSQSAPPNPAHLDKDVLLERQTHLPTTHKFSREPLDRVIKNQPSPILSIKLNHNPFKCPVASCAKSFRKASLLHYHIKYYHSEQKLDERGGEQELLRRRKSLSKGGDVMLDRGTEDQDSICHHDDREHSTMGTEVKKEGGRELDRKNFLRVKLKKKKKGRRDTALLCQQRALLP